MPKFENHRFDDHDPLMQRVLCETTPLLDLVRGVDPDITAEALPGAVKKFLEVTNLRDDAWGMKHLIDMQADAPLFAAPILKIITGKEPAEFQAAWRSFRDCAPVTSDDRRRFESVWPSGRAEPVIGSEIRSELVRIRNQITLEGYLSSAERRVLHDLGEQGAAAETARRRSDFAELGLEWREGKTGRLEPAITRSRFTRATFVDLSSKYFSELLEGLPRGEPHREELRRIYTEARRLSELRETGKIEESERGWRNFLHHDLYAKYGVEAQ